MKQLTGKCRINALVSTLTRVFGYLYVNDLVGEETRREAKPRVWSNVGDM